MKKIFICITAVLSLWHPQLKSQSGADTLVYLLTCGSGTETYSVYGHSAIRITYTGTKQDLVYNWGVFDFNTTNFILKFAWGRLDYMLAVERMQGFMQTYFYEKRYVHCQKLNINSAEKSRLIALINENMRPENVKYRYDFFLDNCSTRIRDLIEKAVGNKLLYPPREDSKPPTFRDLISKYQTSFPWLKFGIDLVVGSRADRAAQYRDRMFLPYFLEKELSDAVISRDGRMIPLLQNPDVILDFEAPVMKSNILTSPATVFTILFIIIMVLSARIKNERFIRWMDIIIFAIFSILALFMIFFNFITDHIQTKWDLNIIWLNPVIIICFILLIIRREGPIWFRIVFYISTLFLITHFFLPQSFSIADMPLVLILIIRSLARSDFAWNPLSNRRT